jgi:hypothetical protein
MAPIEKKRPLMPAGERSSPKSVSRFTLRPKVDSAKER